MGGNTPNPVGLINTMLATTPDLIQRVRNQNKYTYARIRRAAHEERPRMPVEMWIHTELSGEQPETEPHLCFYMYDLWGTHSPLPASSTRPQRGLFWGGK